MRRMAPGQSETASGLLIVVGVAVLGFSILVMVSKSLYKHPPDPNIMTRAQLHSMDAALGLFHGEFSMFPPSEANDPTGKAYCGAMKLSEALMGRDLLGFHSQSVFRRDGMDAPGAVRLYPIDIGLLSPTLRAENLSTRKGPYLQAENANAQRLSDIYGKGKTGPFPEDTYVLCDVFQKTRPSGEKTGMPILYYRANRSNRAHQAGDPNNIYDYRDNLALIALGVPGEPNSVHPLIDPNRFYLNTRNDRITTSPQPVRADSFILISAGWDGLYGTADDICNFEWRYRER